MLRIEISCPTRIGMPKCPVVYSSVSTSIHFTPLPFHSFRPLFIVTLSSLTHLTFDNLTPYLIFTISDAIE